jgi:hypothetical protein
MLPACVHRQCATVAWCSTALRLRDSGAQLAAHCPCLANLAGGGSSMLAAMLPPYSLGLSGGWTRFCVSCQAVVLSMQACAQHAGLRLVTHRAQQPGTDNAWSNALGFVLTDLAASCHATAVTCWQQQAHVTWQCMLLTQTSLHSQGTIQLPCFGYQPFWTRRNSPTNL